MSEETENIIGEFTPKRNEKIIRTLPITPQKNQIKYSIKKENIETKYGIVVYNLNKKVIKNEKGND